MQIEIRSCLHVSESFRKEIEYMRISKGINKIKTNYGGYWSRWVGNQICSVNGRLNMIEDLSLDGRKHSKFPCVSCKYYHKECKPKKWEIKAKAVFFFNETEC
jgi:hypothetical protein